MPILPKDEHCCGCAACFNACAFESIEMTQDELGFYVPSVNLSTCTECKACESVCPTLPFLNFAPYNEIKRKSAFPLTINSAFRASEPPKEVDYRRFAIKNATANLRCEDLSENLDENLCENLGENLDENLDLNLKQNAINSYIEFGESAINRDFTAQNDNFLLNSRKNAANLNDNFSVNLRENLGENLANFI